jgi:alpha-tubulin suppressor-like RCC1 family protein
MCGENTNNRLFLDTRKKTVSTADTFRLVLQHQIPPGGGGAEILDVALGRDRSLVLNAAGEIWSTGEDRLPVRIELAGRGVPKGMAALSCVGVSDRRDMAAALDGTGQ